MSQELTKFSFEIGSLKDAMDYAKLIADSELAPKDYKGKPGNVLIAIQLGMEIGLKPLQAIQNIAVINGRPAVWGDAMIALVQDHPLCEYIKEYTKGDTAYCTVKRRGEDEEYTYQFSKEDEKTAGLAGKSGPWTQYPNRMRQMRARGFALRDKFSDVLKGIAMREEVQDYVIVNSDDKKSMAQNTVKNLIADKSSELTLKIESATTLDELKEAKDLLKQKHAELTKNAKVDNVYDKVDKETGEVVNIEFDKVKNQLLNAKDFDTLNVAADLIDSVSKTADENDELTAIYNTRKIDFK